jgi:hypothetical protein
MKSLFQKILSIYKKYRCPRTSHKNNSYKNFSENRGKTVILVPVSSYIEPSVDESLRCLEKMGFTVWRKYGWSAIDQGRCAIAQEALDAGYEYLFWVDADVAFYPYDVCKMISLGLPFVTAPYSVKGWPSLTTEFYDKNISLGEGGGLYKIKYGATGFMCVHRSVYEKIAQKLNLKKVKIWGGQYEAYPFFFPIIENEEYLGEDFAFCKRARDAGFELFCDTRIRLSHIGKYSYSYEFLKSGVKDEPSSVKYIQSSGLKYN